MTNILNVLRGLVLNPRLVAFARGSLEAFAMGLILIFSDATWLGEQLPEILKPLIPMIVLGMRMVEGHADAIDPAKQRRRDALREEAAAAEITDGQAGPLNPGDVVDPAVDAAIESYNNGDIP